MGAKRINAQRTAFTLVELLVVVAIVALLASILMPSLRQAREQGRRIKCAAHLKGLSTSWEVYTIEFKSAPQLARRGVDVNYDCSSLSNCRREDYRGFGPDTFNDYLAGNSDAQVWISATSFRHVLFQVSNPPPAGPLPGHFWNWGLMWQSGVVEQPEVFFCPSMRNADFAWNTPLNPWPPRRETMWRPDVPTWVNHTQASFERRIALTGVPWDRVPSQTMLAHDLGAPNVAETAHRTGANVTYRDGHVIFLRGTQFTGWWDKPDQWGNVDTRRKLLQLSYWMDTEGRWPFDPSRAGE